MELGEPYITENSCPICNGNSEEKYFGMGSGSKRCLNGCYSAFDGAFDDVHVYVFDKHFTWDSDPYKEGNREKYAEIWKLVQEEIAYWKEDDRYKEKWEHEND